MNLGHRRLFFSYIWVANCDLHVFELQTIHFVWIWVTDDDFFIHLGCKRWFSMYLNCKRCILHEFESQTIIFSYIWVANGGLCMYLNCKRCILHEFESQTMIFHTFEFHPQRILHVFELQTMYFVWISIWVTDYDFFIHLGFQRWFCMYLNCKRCILHEFESQTMLFCDRHVISLWEYILQRLNLPLKTVP